MRKMTILEIVLQVIESNSPVKHVWRQVLENASSSLFPNGQKHKQTSNHMKHNSPSQPVIMAGPRETLVKDSVNLVH